MSKDNTISQWWSTGGPIAWGAKKHVILEK